MARGTALSLPNILTYARIAAVPAVAVCHYVPGDEARWTAVAIFVAAAVTDFFDGYLARAWQQQSALGRMLDPIADKLLVAARDLNPQKSRLLLQLLLANGTRDAASVQAAFDPD